MWVNWYTLTGSDWKNSACVTLHVWCTTSSLVWSDVQGLFVHCNCSNSHPNGIIIVIVSIVLRDILSWIYVKPNLCVCLFFVPLHSHSFERICMKFGLWHPYTLWMVMVGLASADWARGLALRMPSIRRCIWLTTLVAWHSGRMSFSGRRTFPVLCSTCSRRVTTYVGKPSAIGQPTRPTQPFIASGSIDGVVSCNWMSLTPVRGRHLVNAYEGKAGRYLQVKLCDPCLSTSRYT